jgi:5'-3' exonuclease
MGIPTFFSYIVKNHANVIKTYDSTAMQVNNFYLDCNSIIYDCVHSIDFASLVESDIVTIINSVCCKIEEYVKILKPNNILFIAFDGVAPVAKLEQQRGRRYKSMYQNGVSKSIFGQNGKECWNTAAITPGTVFMNQLNNEIKSRFTNPMSYGVTQIIISASDLYGEGEHKIFQYIRNNATEIRNDINVVYGLDADLIMLAINHLPIAKNISLFRETPDYIKSINIELEPNKSYIIDIPQLAEIITLDMDGPICGGQERLPQKNRIYDYIFMCFFLGNDFLPHFPAVNIATGGVDKMLNAYKAVIGNTAELLTDGTTIFWKNVLKLVTFLSTQEEEYIRAETKLRDKRERYILPGDTPEELFKKFDAIPMYERAKEKYINPFKSGWQVRYYKTLFELDIDDIRRKQICVNYLEGLEWTMKYYTVGCSDWRWCYQYHYPPLLQDFIRFIPYFSTEFIQNKPANPVNELVQLSYVLPKQSLHLLPGKLYEALLREHNDWYKADCTFVWSYCRYFWESHVDLPHIDINELEEFVRENK